MSEFHKLPGGVFASPQIVPADIDEAARLGVTLVINNRPEGEAEDQTPGPQIEAAARAAGMDYVAIPVTMQTLSDADVVAMRDALKEMPGVRIAADISPATVNEQGGYDTMKLILAANADVDVVLGADTVVLGALRALREAGKARPDQFLGGIDGEPEAVAEIKRQDSPYKASVALSSPVFGYALGAFAADWLDGKSVPQGLDVLPFALTAENMAQYEADQLDPGAVYNDPVRRGAYLRMFGNICYDTRDQYLNFPWSSYGQ